MKINEIETSTNPSIFTNIGSTNHWGVAFILYAQKLKTKDKIQVGDKFRSKIVILKRSYAFDFCMYTFCPSD